jgi:hypothetical protein
VSTTNFQIFPGALDSILHGPDSLAQEKRQAEKIADAWRGNIHTITGATDRSIDVEQDGFSFIVSADATRDPNSAWSYLEWGTSKMRAQAPARRAIR